MHKPFSILEEWVREGRIRLSVPLEISPNGNGAAPPEEVEARADFVVEELPENLPDEALFEFAMRDVKSLGWSDVPLAERPPLELRAHDQEQEALRELEEFIRHGNVELQQTAEYIEASIHPHGRLYLDDLRAGRFSIQAHLDLHGLTLEDARFVLDEFILESLRAGFACVRVIHGRGHHSQNHHSVLKENIQLWLRSRRMSRHVLAYTSARRCDGGGGAVYVLLRR